MRRVSEFEIAGGGSSAAFGEYESAGVMLLERPCADPAPQPELAPVARETERARWLSDHVVPHEPWLRRWLVRRGFDQEVEDVIQESYALLIQAERVDHVRHPRNYFCQTARSVILRKVRRDAIVRIECTACGEMPDYASDLPLPDREVAAREELRLVFASLDRLPKRTRDVFLLRRVEGLSLSATAARLGISQSAVEKHLRTAMRSLAEYCGRTAACA